MMKTTLIAFVAAAACLVSLADATNWRPCPGSRTEKFTVEGCEGRRVCNLRRGKFYWVEMQFRGSADSNGLTAAVLGKSRGMDTAMQLSSSKFDSNACDYLDTNCPVRRNALHTYRYPLYIEPFFPASTYLISYGLKDVSGKMHGCARVIIRIQ